MIWIMICPIYTLGVKYWKKMLILKNNPADRIVTMSLLKTRMGL